MRATYAVENVVQTRMKELGCTASFVAALYGMSQGRMSTVLSGQKDFTHEEGEALVKLTTRLIDIRNALGFVPLDLRDVKKVRDLLSAMDAAGVTTEQVQEVISHLFKSHLGSS
jgi:hypothetical protein